MIQYFAEVLSLIHMLSLTNLAVFYNTLKAMKIVIIQKYGTVFIFRTVGILVQLLIVYPSHGNLLI